jgi:hypothetical protein
MDLKKDFLKEAKVIEREGIKELLKYLDSTDFYSAPASTQYHNCFEGGLIMHSLSVYDVLKELKDVLGIDDVEDESLAICGLFHDICKANYYVRETRNKKIDGKWHEVEVWSVKDKLPMGHGEKSVYILQKYIELTDEEALAIRWHLGGFDPGVHFNYPSGYAQKQAFKENKLVALLATADLAASYLLDTYEEDK